MTVDEMKALLKLRGWEIGTMQERTWWCMTSLGGLTVPIGSRDTPPEIIYKQVMDYLDYLDSRANLERG
jgi:hypothetical protein